MSAEVQASPSSRAVSRQIEPGQATPCARCECSVGFVARQHLRRIIANVYVHADNLGRKRVARPGTGGTWDRMEVWHPECYAEAGEPYGPA